MIHLVRPNGALKTRGLCLARCTDRSLKNDGKMLELLESERLHVTEAILLHPSITQKLRHVVPCGVGEEDDDFPTLAAVQMFSDVARGCCHGGTAGAPNHEALVPD